MFVIISSSARSPLTIHLSKSFEDEISGSTCTLPTRFLDGVWASALRTLFTALMSAMHESEISPAAFAISIRLVKVTRLTASETFPKFPFNFPEPRSRTVRIASTALSSNRCKARIEVKRSAASSLCRWRAERNFIHRCFSKFFITAFTKAAFFESVGFAGRMIHFPRWVDNGGTLIPKGFHLFKFLHPRNRIRNPERVHKSLNHYIISNGCPVLVLQEVRG